MTRAAYTKLSKPIAKGALRAGFTPDSITILGTAGAVVAALTLFPIGQLWWGAFAVSFFVLADMLDGAMARERGGGTRFGAVLDATCDRLSDGAIFAGLLWWAAFGLESASLVVATLICLITSQVISYAKARAEASGLSGDGGIIERPERLFIVMLGTWLSDLPFFPLPWVLHVTMWGLAVASIVTLLQRMHTVRTSPGAMDRLTPAPEPSETEVSATETGDTEAGKVLPGTPDSADEAPGVETSSVERSSGEKPGTSQS
jgi:CDP-diacylglycerol--glycerol-3-phosphate 3-phosphatidyltransferase